MRRVAAGMLLIGLASVPLLTASVGRSILSGGAQVASDTQPSQAEAARFLTQATFGPTDAAIAEVQSSGYAGWIDQQEAMPVSASHQDFVDRRIAVLTAVNPHATIAAFEFYDSFWQQAATSPDQLRQRVKLALSEIFVFSLSRQQFYVRGGASYYDMLGANAFGNYRTLLDQVDRHPMMGKFLTYLGNVKENPFTGQHPDENFAREIQQLMSTGLYQLNQDGSNKTDANGNSIPTYTISDIQGLAKVFTGFGWYSPSPTNSTFYGSKLDPNAAVTPMTAYPRFHSTSAKSFLGTTIPASSTADPEGDLKIALDTIFNQPSVGPFVSRQLIQRLVTSNPSPAYISRIAGVFNDNGAGVRGDLGAVVKAILLDPEARDPTAITSPTFGKLREPVVRLANWMRAFDATSHSGWWLIGDTSSPQTLDQATLDVPSVFNFWRLGYSPPHTSLGAANLVAPEFQVVEEVSVAGYLNTMRKTIGGGIGTLSLGIPDVTASYAKEIALAGDPGSLTDRLNLLLFYGQMSSGLRTRILKAVSSVAIPSGSATPDQIKAALINRVELATYIAFASPEYLAQR